jgi:TPR repeat protein
MNTSRPTHLFVRCTLWMGALLAAAAVSAGPAEDVKEADTAFLSGDIPTAMALLRKAADQGHPLAEARLGDLLRAAEFEAEAIVYYRKSAEKGEPAGEVGLARALADGAGIKKDPAQALALYRKAEARNYGPAHDMLARAYRTGTLGLPKDLAKAKEHDQKARELGVKPRAEGGQ